MEASSKNQASPFVPAAKRSRKEKDVAAAKIQARYRGNKARTDAAAKTVGKSKQNPGVYPGGCDGCLDPCASSSDLHQMLQDLRLLVDDSLTQQRAQVLASFRQGLGEQFEEFGRQHLAPLLEQHFHEFNQAEGVRRHRHHHAHHPHRPHHGHHPHHDHGHHNEHPHFPLIQARHGQHHEPEEEFIVINQQVKQSMHLGARSSASSASSPLAHGARSAGFSPPKPQLHLPQDLVGRSHSSRHDAWKSKGKIASGRLKARKPRPVDGNGLDDSPHHSIEHNGEVLQDRPDIVLPVRPDWALPPTCLPEDNVQVLPPHQEPQSLELPSRHDREIAAPPLGVPADKMQVHPPHEEPQNLDLAETSPQLSTLRNGASSWTSSPPPAPPVLPHEVPTLTAAHEASSPAAMCSASNSKSGASPCHGEGETNARATALEKKESTTPSFADNDNVEESLVRFASPPVDAAAAEPQQSSSADGLDNASGTTRSRRESEASTVSFGDGAPSDGSGKLKKKKTMMRPSVTRKFVGEGDEARRAHSNDKSLLGHLMAEEDTFAKQLAKRVVPETVYNHLQKQDTRIQEDTARRERYRTYLALQSWQFEVGRACCVMLDMFILAWNIHDAAVWVEENPKELDTGVGDSFAFVVVTDIFAALFCGEMVARFITERIQILNVVRNPWRFFNLIMALIYAVQAMSQHLHVDHRGYSKLRVWSTRLAMFRIVRLFQIIGKETKMIRQGTLLKEFRCMVYSLGGAMWSLLWSSLMILTLLTMFGMFFTEASINYAVHHKGFAELEETVPLRQHFGNLTKTILSLFKAITGGDDWGNIYDSLKPLGLYYRGLFLGFIAFSVIALLNVVTAVFVESTMERSQNDREQMTQNEMKAKQEFLQKMQQVFRELDEDGDDEINLEELQNRMKDDPKIGAYFASLGVDVVQVGKLFSLLDADSSGSISSDEFMFGCLRLKGEAKSLDLAVLGGEISRMRIVLYEISDMIEAMMDDDSSTGSSCASEPPFRAGDQSSVVCDIQPAGEEPVSAHAEQEAEVGSSVLKAEVFNSKTLTASHLT